MNAQAFIQGFVKRAASYGVADEVAVEMLKQAGLGSWFARQGKNIGNWAAQQGKNIMSNPTVDNLLQKAKVNFGVETGGMPYPLHKRELEGMQTLSQPATSGRILQQHASAMPDYVQTRNAIKDFKKYNTLNQLNANTTGNNISPQQLAAANQKALESFNKIQPTLFESSVQSGINAKDWMQQNPIKTKAVGLGAAGLGLNTALNQMPESLGGAQPDAPTPAANPAESLYGAFGFEPYKPKMSN